MREVNAPRVNQTPMPAARLHLAIMIWAAAFPTLTALQFLLGEQLRNAPLVLRPLILSTLAVPTVVYILLPGLQRVRSRLVSQR